MKNIVSIVVCVSSIASLSCMELDPDARNQSTSPSNSLRQVLSGNVQDILITNPLPGELLVQQQVVSDFMSKLPTVIKVDTATGGCEVDMKNLRNILKYAVVALPRPESSGEVDESALRARELLKKSIELHPASTITTVTIDRGKVHVTSESPRTAQDGTQSQPAVSQTRVQITQVSDLKPVEEITRLQRLLTTRGSWAKVGAIGSTVFVAGMIAGWFYTTKLHHAQELLKQNAHN